MGKKIVIDEEYLLNVLLGNDVNPFDIEKVLKQSTPLEDIVKPIIKKSFKEGVRFKEGFRSTAGMSEDIKDKFANICATHLLKSLDNE